MKTNLSLLFLLCLSHISLKGQNAALSPQDTKILYGQTTFHDVKIAMDRVFSHVDKATPFGIVNRVTGEPISDLTKPLKEATFTKSEYKIASHEWGLAYSGMLLAGETTGDRRFTDYVSRRFEFLARASVYFRAYKKAFPAEEHPLEHFLDPELLDDTGSLCASMIQAVRKSMVKE